MRSDYAALQHLRQTAHELWYTPHAIIQIIHTVNALIINYLYAIFVSHKIYEAKSYNFQESVAKPNPTNIKGIPTCPTQA